MEDQKRKNYLVYFKFGVVDAVVNNMADNSYMKSSAYYKKGFEFGLTMGEIAMNKKIISFKVYDDDEQKTLVSDNDLNKILEVLENNGYIVEVKYKQNQTIEKTINR